MDRNRSLLWPFILITIACILAVEVGYRVLRQSLVNATAILQHHSIPTIATAGRKSGGLAGQQIILARNLFAAKPGTGEKSHGEARDGGGVTQSGVLEVVLMGTVEDSAGTSRAVFLDIPTSVGIGHDMMRSWFLWHGRLLFTWFRLKWAEL